MGKKVSGAATVKLAGNHLNVTQKEVEAMTTREIATLIRRLAGSVVSQAEKLEKLSK